MQHIAINHISKKLDSKHIFQDLSCTIEAGEFVYLTGVSGAGKTQLLRVLAGLQRVDSGEVWVHQYPLHTIAKNRLYMHTRKVGFVFQSSNLLEHYTVQDNLVMPLLIRNVPYKQIIERIQDQASELHIQDLLNKPVSKLSGGQQQLVAIARALIIKPVLLLADEPTANLDWTMSQYILDIFHKYHAQGGTVILATHHKELMHTYKHRVLMIYRKALKEIRI